VRQVPEQSLPYGIVGQGRMARHWKHYLELKGIPSKSWDRDSSFFEFTKSTRVILLLISDSAIESFIEQNKTALQGKKIVHFSGSMSLESASGLHPLMTFADHLYPLELYESIPFVCEEGMLDFTQAFPELPNPSFVIPSRMKPLYHSLCVTGGNFTTLLWQMVMDAWEKDLRLPSEILRPFLQQTVANVWQERESALTGPLARRDLPTIESNLKALGDSSLGCIYRTFLKSKNIEVPKL